MKHLFENLTKPLLVLKSCPLGNAKLSLTKSQFVLSLVNITDKVRQITIMLQTDVEKEFLNEAYELLLLNVKQLLSQMSELKLPMIKLRRLDLTDAGPGVAVSNGDVCFLDTEMAMFLGSDWRCRCHRAKGDSCQIEAKRTNSALRDAIADEGAIAWEYYEQFNNLTDEQVQNLSLKEYTEHEEARMEKNDWKVSVDLKNRLDDGPVLKDFVKAHFRKPEGKQFFFNRDNLMQYLNAQSEQNKMSVPGHGYMEAVKEFYDMH